MVMTAYYAKDMGDMFNDEEDGTDDAGGIKMRKKTSKNRENEDVQKNILPAGLRISQADVAYIDDPLGTDPRLSLSSINSKNTGRPEL